MPNVVLDFAITPYDRVVPLITGEVKPAGITLNYQGLPGGVPGMFYDQIKNRRFDLSEFSFSSFLIERAKGFPYRALPVFQARGFSYTGIIIKKSSGIRQDHPEDLKGKRFAVGDYQQTAALWCRGVLLHEFGIKPEDLDWWQTRGEHLSHTGASGTKLPPGVNLHYADSDVSALFARGAVDASLGWGAPENSSIDRRSSIDLRNDPDYTTLFSDPKAEAIRFFKKTGVFPTHHTTIVRESILKQHPWAAMSLFEAFEESKKLALSRLRAQVPTLMVFGPHYLKEVRDAFGEDPWPNGIKANLPTIDMGQQISVEQGLTNRKMSLDLVFAEEVLVAEERLPGPPLSGEEHVVTMRPGSHGVSE